MNKRRGVAWSLVAVLGVLFALVLFDRGPRETIGTTTAVREPPPVERPRETLEPLEPPEGRSLAPTTLAPTRPADGSPAREDEGDGGPLEYRISGSVRRLSQGEPAPVEGALFTVRRRSGGELPPVDDVETGPDGSFALVLLLPALTAENEDQDWLTFELQAPLHPTSVQTWTGSKVRRKSRDREISLSFQLGEPRAMVRGRVVDEEGDPVRWATVLAFDPVTDGFLTMVMEESRESGAYELDPRGASVVGLRAFRTNLGLSQTLRNVRIEDGRDTTAEDLVIRSGETLAGTVSLPGGEPLAHVRLRAVAYPERKPSLHVNSGVIFPFDAVPGLEAMPGGWTESDAEGRFRFEGLGPGTYTIRPAAGELSLLEGHAGPYAASRRDLEIVAERYVVHGRVVADGDGLPEDVRVAVRTWSAPGAELLASIVDGTVLDGEQDVEPRTLSHSEWDLLARPGDVLRFDGVAPGHEPGAAVVEIHRGTYDYEISLVLRPAVGKPRTGIVRLQATDVPERALLRVEVTSPRGVVLDSWVVRGRDQKEFVFMGEAGTCWVRAALMGHMGQEYSPMVQAIEVLADQVTEVPLVFEPAGVLVIRLEVPPSRVGARLAGRFSVRSVTTDRVVWEHDFTFGATEAVNSVPVRSLEPVEYQVTVEVDGAEPLRANATVLVGERSTVTFEIAP